MELAVDIKIYNIAKPFVKWAGGKGQLLDTFEKYYPPLLKKKAVKRYIEPFVGGGAVLFEIMQKFDIKEAYIYDINEELINTYIVIKHNVDALIEFLSGMEDCYLKLDKTGRKEMFYKVRKEYNSGTIKKAPDIKRASQFIFLNRTCFNGLYRVNRKGHFNVPCGDYKNPTICDSSNLYAASVILQRVNMFACDYRESAKHICKDSFVYFDPPYRPLNTTSSFTSYSKFDFTDENQVQLAEFYKKMNETGAFLMLSNSDPKNSSIDDNFFDNLYQDFFINRVKAKRAINSNGENRGSINEILVTNYKVDF